MSAGYQGRQRSTSSAGSRSHRRDLLRPATPIDPRTDETDLDPCTATGSFLVYTHGSAVVLLHHDTLKLERRFERHSERVTLVAVDNASERGAGRFCVSYDVGMTALVWDLYTGDEIARFISYEPIKVATWMKNGSIAFGMTPTFKWGEGDIALTVRRQLSRRRRCLRAQDIRTLFVQDDI